MNSVSTSRKLNLVAGLSLGMVIALPLVPVHAEQVDGKAGSAARGAKSWSENCTRCHEIRDPMEFRDDLWKPILTHMRVRAGLTGQQQRDILAFLQASNNPLPVSTSTAGVAQARQRSGLSGNDIYNQTCAACHGADGTGALPGTPNFTAPNGPLSKTDEVLITHITEGFKSPGSPMAMPAKGGNPALTGEDIRAVLAYLRKTFGAAPE